MTDLQQALEDALFLFPREGENASERAERVNEAFFEETGTMAPGKAVAARMVGSQPTPEERREEYEAWCQERVERARKALEELQSLLLSVDSLVAHYNKDRMNHKHVESVEEKMPPRVSLYPGGGEA